MVAGIVKVWGCGYVDEEVCVDSEAAAGCVAVIEVGSEEDHSYKEVLA